MAGGKEFAFILWCVVNTWLVKGRCNKYICYFVNLTKMPDLSITPSINTIYICDSNITIPADVFINVRRRITNVKIIENKVRYIHPSAFRGLKVSSLSLRSNFISNIGERTFSNLGEYLGTLSLNDNKLSVINRGMFKGLVFRRRNSKLELGGNNIDTIECESFLHIGKLSTLQLSYNRLVNLQKEMFLGLFFLEKIHLEHNKIRYVENGTFEAMKLLKELYLQNNFVEYIAIHRLTSLERLNLSENNLHILQEGMFDNLPVLEDIDLSNNKISNIEATFFKNIKKVGKLNLQGNKLTYINKDSFKEIPKIKTLDIGNNEINKIEYEAFTHVMPGYFILNVDGNVLQYLSWKTFTSEIPPYRKRRFNILSFGKLKCVRELCWMKQGYQNFITVERGPKIWRKKDRKDEPLNECYRSLYCPSTDLCGLNQTQCEENCTSQEREYVLSYEDHVCPYQQFCNCTCPEFNSTSCEANCSRNKTRPAIGAKNKGYCPICDCSCPMFNSVRCKENCAMEEKLGTSIVDEKGCYSCNCRCPIMPNCSSICPGHDYILKTSKFGCEECHCLCPDGDCDTLCNGPGLGIVDKDDAGCRVCKGCRNPSVTGECIDCESQCHVRDTSHPVTKNSSIHFVKSENRSRQLDSSVFKEINVTNLLVIQDQNQTEYAKDGTMLDGSCYRSCEDCPPALHDNSSQALTVGIILPCALLLLIVIVVVSVIYRKVKRCTGEEEDLVLDFGFQGDVKLVLLINNLDLELGEQITKCWIKPGTFSIGHLLGHGNFGTVWSGILSLSKESTRITEASNNTMKNNEGEEMQIAVKKIKGKRDPATVEEFLREAIVMRMLDHPHVLSLIGVSVNEEKPCVLLPFMSNGDLKSYVTKRESDLTLKDLLIFGVGVAEGMVYISDQKFVHRDLAARNCMLDSDLVVKVADFGLTRDVYEKNYYRLEDKNKGLPIRWMSLEAIQEGRFTTYSDVWSFGVLLWEIFTFGSEPYPGLENIEVEQYLLENRRLRKPTMAPDYIYDIMYSCWNLIPQERSTFATILSWLNNYADVKTNYMEMTHDPVEAEGIQGSKTNGLEDEDGYLIPVNRATFDGYEKTDDQYLDQTEEHEYDNAEPLEYQAENEYAEPEEIRKEDRACQIKPQK